MPATVAVPSMPPGERTLKPPQVQAQTGEARRAQPQTASVRARQRWAKAAKSGTGIGLAMW